MEKNRYEKAMKRHDDNYLFLTGFIHSNDLIPSRGICAEKGVVLEYYRLNKSQ